MPSHRYLLHIAYNGKPFRGFQRQVKAQVFKGGQISRPDDPSTVQGQLEMGLKILNPAFDPVIVPSSRTDSGVHAMNSTCHVDLHRDFGSMYQPRTLTICLNKYFSKEDVPIRILQTYIVPETFSSRHNAVSRTYLYRMARIKSEELNMAPSLRHIPIEELERCYFICTNEFDVDKMRVAAKLFEGLHDFRTFMRRDSDSDSEKVTRRFINRIEVLNARPAIYSNYSWPSCVNDTIEDYQFYDIYIQARGFLYRQVRRMVGSLIAVAQGKISLSDLKFMIQVPSHLSWNDRVKIVPARGLYLCEVEYSQVDKASFQSTL